MLPRFTWSLIHGILSLPDQSRKSSNHWATIFLACLYQWNNFFSINPTINTNIFLKCCGTTMKALRFIFKRGYLHRTQFKLSSTTDEVCDNNLSNACKEAGGEARRVKKVTGLQTASISNSSCSTVSITNQNSICTYTHRSLTILRGYQLSWLPLPPAHILFL